MIVEADGQWHTSDNQYACASWRAAHPPPKALSLSLPPTPIKHPSPTTARPAAIGNDQKNGLSSSEIFILDSDDEEEGQVKRELSPSVPRSYTTSLASIGSIPPRSQTVTSDVIDLTLDSDDEAPPARVPPPSLHPPSPPPPPPPSNKRKTDELDLVSPTESVWKKSRIEGLALPAISTLNGTSPLPHFPNGDHYSPPPPPPSRDPRLPHLPLDRLPVRPQPFTNSYIPPGGAPVPSRPSIPRRDSYGNPSSRANGTTSWGPY